MKNLNRELSRFKDNLKKEDQILAAFLFGSVSRDDSYSGSDVDICLVMKQGIYTPLELSQKKLEYLNSFNMDIQIFQQLPLYIKIRIIKEGKCLFCVNEDALYQIAFSTISEFEDYKHIYHDYLKEVANAR